MQKLLRVHRDPGFCFQDGFDVFDLFRWIDIQVEHLSFFRAHGELHPARPLLSRIALLRIRWIRSTWTWDRFDLSFDWFWVRFVFRPFDPRWRRKATDKRELWWWHQAEARDGRRQRACAGQMHAGRTLRRNQRKSAEEAAARRGVVYTVREVDRRSDRTVGERKSNPLDDGQERVRESQTRRRGKDHASSGRRSLDHLGSSRATRGDPSSSGGSTRFHPSPTVIDPWPLASKARK
mmetsp:Transcript_8427/g.52698  ORF Transcript_8427/g.52698 Transcript_8427/m.52698 type:complete len:236 (-) Transcript_8427:36-743(-)